METVIKDVLLEVPDSLEDLEPMHSILQHVVKLLQQCDRLSMLLAIVMSVCLFVVCRYSRCCRWP